MTKTMRQALATALVSLAASFGATALASDTSADAPGGFDAVMNQTHGVVLRVPVNERGEENTNAAELRFFQKDQSVTTATNPGALWNNATDLGKTPEVLGTNAPRTVDTSRDTSTWGWYNWYNYGWVYPYYYTYYYPTFYYSNYWWHFSYYTNWNWYGYRYYYFNWWY